MKQLSNEELNATTGGGWGFWAVCCGIGIFAAGVIDGYIRPNRCK